MPHSNHPSQHCAPFCRLSLDPLLQTPSSSSSLSPCGTRAVPPLASTPPPIRFRSPRFFIKFTRSTSTVAFCTRRSRSSRHRVYLLRGSDLLLPPITRPFLLFAGLSNARSGACAVPSSIVGIAPPSSLLATASAPPSPAASTTPSSVSKAATKASAATISTSPSLPSPALAPAQATAAAAAARAVSAAWIPVQNAVHWCMSEWTRVKNAVHWCMREWIQVQSALHRCAPAWIQVQSALHGCASAWIQVQSAVYGHMCAWIQVQNAVHRRMSAWTQVQNVVPATLATRITSPLLLLAPLGAPLWSLSSIRPRGKSSDTGWTRCRGSGTACARLICWWCW